LCVCGILNNGYELNPNPPPRSPVMSSKKCPNCQLVNFAHVTVCKRCQLSFSDSPTSQTTGESNVATWYFYQVRERIGPVGEEILVQQAKLGNITGETLVWQDGMLDWKPVGQTSLARLFRSPNSVPPPLARATVDDTLVWVLAFAPILSGIAVTFLLTLFDPASDKAGRFFVFALLLRVGFNSVLCISDVERLKKAGHNTKDLILMGLFLVPVYLFVRASRLKQDYSYAIVWLVSFVISLGIFHV